MGVWSLTRWDVFGIIVSAIACYIIWNL